MNPAVRDLGCRGLFSGSGPSRTDRFGASLSYLEERLGARGYRLVGATLSGINAFFVRDDLAQDRFLEPFTADRHYEPPRYFLTRRRTSHPPDYGTLDTRVDPDAVA